MIYAFAEYYWNNEIKDGDVTQDVCHIEGSVSGMQGPNPTLSLT